MQSIEKPKDVWPTGDETSKAPVPTMPTPPKKPRTPPMPTEFVRKETLGGFFLIVALVVALVCANSGLKESYEALWQTQMALSFQEQTWHITTQDIINEVLMSLFFLLIGCELKRECREGELASAMRIRLPLVAALGGMLVPALFYIGTFLLARKTGSIDGHDAILRGWAIPTATDIPFALGVLGFLGSRIPTGLRTFLMALAVIDDLGAVLVIGLFYTSTLHMDGLVATLGIVAFLTCMNRCKIRALFPYLFAGVLLWIAMHHTGIHATLAGVILAAFVPLNPTNKATTKNSPLRILEHALHPFIVYGILPLFALANAGVPFVGISAKTMANPITLGIFAGLFFGKPIGVLLSAWLATKLGFAHRPRLVTWKHLTGVSFLCGIGFTMSLFIGVLAFADAPSFAAVRLGVLMGSALAATVGSILLLLPTSPKPKKG